MAIATFVHDGKSIDYTPTSAVSAGDVVVLGDLVGIAKIDIAASTLGALAVTGVFDLAKDDTSGPVFAAGDPVYYDRIAELAVPAPGAGGGVLLGTCLQAAGASDATVRVQLNQPATAALVDRLWEAVDIDSASKTLDAEDVGKVLNVSGDATNVVTLPATAAGVQFVIRAAVDGLRVAVSPNASDKIMGPNVAGTDNKDWILTAATARAGDYVHLAADGSAGWFILAQRGVWVSE